MSGLIDLIGVGDSFFVSFVVGIVVVGNLLEVVGLGIFVLVFMI